MKPQTIVSAREWLEARRQLLAKEKEFTRLRDQLSRQRRALPWVRVDKTYNFDGPDGRESLAQLFAGKSQLVVYHFMFGPDWQEGCPSCSFWADNFDGIDIHLAQRDISFVAVSRAEYEKLSAYKQRMGWTFKWVSSHASEFNEDFYVSFSPADKEKNAVFYNYREQPYFMDELPGVSVFYRDGDNEIYHTYSAYARGLDILNGAYNYIDLTPKGRNEENAQSWVRRHDQYESAI